MSNPPPNIPTIVTIVSMTFVGFAIAVAWLKKQIAEAKQELQKDIDKLEQRVTDLENNQREARGYLLEAYTDTVSNHQNKAAELIRRAIALLH